MKCVMSILNYNDSRRALELAERCVKFDSIERIIIVDNKSTDDSVTFLTERVGSNIELVVASENRGFAAGNNIGAKYAQEKYNPEYILFANTDTIFSETEVNACLSKLKAKADLGLISMRIKDIKGNEEKSAWHFKSFLDYTLFNIWIYRHITYKKGVYKSFSNYFQYVDIVRGSFMLFKMKALIEANFFDENTFLYYEEEIIAYRLRKHGYKVGLLTNYFYIHNHIASGTGNIWFIKKHLDASLRWFLINYYNIGNVKIRIFDFATKICSCETFLIEQLKRRGK